MSELDPQLRPRMSGPSSAKAMGFELPTGTDPHSIRQRVVWEARNLGMSKWHLTRMAGNVGFDALLGIVPVVGDAADFMFRSNTRNLRIIKKHLDKHHPATKVIEG